MNLRYKLFLTVGSLFFIAFVLSFYLENKITTNKLSEAKKVLHQKILQLNEVKRQHIEQFLVTTIAQGMAEVSTLLQNLGEYKQFFTGFTPTEQALQRGTWINAATTLLSNKWIDFIQNTDEGILTSLIMPNAQELKSASHAHVDPDFSWITLEGEEPLLGVRYYVDISKDIIALPSAVPGVSPSVFILFSPEGISRYLQEWPANHPAYTENFFLRLKHAEEYVKQMPGDPIKRKEWIEQAISSIPLKEPSSNQFRCLPDVNYSLQQEIGHLLNKNDELFLVWRFASILPRGPFSPGAPKGIARFYGDEAVGEGFLQKKIFSSSLFFDDKSYYEANHSKKVCWHPATSIAVINAGKDKNVFLGNTLQTSYENRLGYLTVGRNVDPILLELALSLNKTAFFVHNDEIVSAFSPDGEKIQTPENVPLDKMLQEKSGILHWKGEKYFFLHMIPFPAFDLHFFVIDLESKEFAFVNAMDEGAKRLVASLSFDMRIAAVLCLLLVLLMLHVLSKRITKPVTQLADAAEQVKSGHLEEVSIPEAGKDQHDEVAVLCQSFANMVQGLKEKEKVKAVLDKVVSEEIAQEILKGNVHLGGEEKRVTVLFADIRDFTRITSKMAPAEVIELLNTCMTKISKSVDDNGGVIDKYVGDEVMALFGAPIDNPYSAVQAVCSAVQMIEILKEWNAERKVKGLDMIEMGIGIHTGIVLAGNMGADNRLNYTVLGSNVNFAARLCSSAQRGQILISRDTYESSGVKEKIEVESLPLAKFKGFEEEMEVFAVKGIKE